MFLNDMSGCRVWGGQSGPHVAGVCCHGNVIVRVNIVGFCKDQNVIVNIKHSSNIHAVYIYINILFYILYIYTYIFTFLIFLLLNKGFHMQN